MQSSILCLFFATFDISNPISKWKHESLWTLFVRRVMRWIYIANCRCDLVFWTFYNHPKCHLVSRDWMMQRKRWNVFQTSKSDSNRTKKTTIFFFFPCPYIDVMANFNVAKLKSKFIFVDLAFKCALHFHLDFCLQTIFLPVLVRYTSWSHQSINLWCAKPIQIW